MRAAPRAASVSRSDSRLARGRPIAAILRRLRTRAQFQAVLAGRTVSRTAHFALHSLDPCAPAAVAADPPDSTGLHHPLFACGGATRVGWLGAMTPKRWARRAVTRNSIRRQIHAVSAAFEDRLSGAAHVVRLRAAFDRAQFVSATSDALKQAVRAELRQLFSRLPVSPRSSFPVKPE